MRVQKYLSPLPALAALALVAATPASERGDEVLVPRIRAHFDSVLVELVAADVGALTETQRVNRATLTKRLRAYRNRGVFPHNYDFPGQAIPYFIDRKTGTLCAVAHLLASTGRRDIVQRVARSDNNVWVAELGGDVEFEQWLADNGLTLAYAARIQVPYVIGDAPTPQPAGESQAFPVATAGFVGVSALTLWPRAGGRSLARDVIGATSGAASVFIGLKTLSNRGIQPLTSVASIAIGTVSLFRAGESIQQRRTLAEKRRADAARVAIAPLLPTQESGTGLSVTLRF